MGGSIFLFIFAPSKCMHVWIYVYIPNMGMCVYVYVCRIACICSSYSNGKSKFLLTFSLTSCIFHHLFIDVWASCHNNFLQEKVWSYTWCHTVPAKFTLCVQLTLWTCLTFPARPSKTVSFELNTQSTPHFDNQLFWGGAFVLSCRFSWSRHLSLSLSRLLCQSFDWCLSHPVALPQLKLKTSNPFDLYLDLRVSTTHMKTHTPDTAALSPILVKSTSISAFSSRLLKVCQLFYSHIMIHAYGRRRFAFLLDFSKQITTVTE